MFSSTTIESSTRMPMVKASAISDTMSRLKPRKYITRKVEISEVGIARSTISVFRQRWRNTSKTTPVSSTASWRSNSTASSECRVKIDVSLVIVIVTSGGSDR